MKLTTSQIDSAKPKSRPYKLFDGGGLFLMVNPSGSKIWYLSYRFNEKASQISFGPYPLVSFEEARKQRDKAKALLQAGVKPSKAKKLKVAKAKKSAKAEAKKTIRTTAALGRYIGGRLDAVMAEVDDLKVYINTVLTDEIEDLKSRLSAVERELKDVLYIYDTFDWELGKPYTPVKRRGRTAQI